MRGLGRVGLVVIAVGLLSLPVGANDGEFTDVASNHVFAKEVTWLAESGITRGCNPPQNSRFCPDDRVTRGQMAAFLVRALELSETGPAFSDTGGHVFAGDITRLAGAGITRGCNPPDNSRFCPDDPVTRGQMAAFLARALELGEGNATFSDTAGHVFAADVSRLATAGITRGCNPPDNSRFCPDDLVTRGQMAAFLHRALSTEAAGPGGGDGTVDHFVQMAAGSIHTCALTEGGSVYCWGLSSSGLGTEDVVRTHTPTRVQGLGGNGHLTGVTQVAANGNTTCAATESGAAYCWGHNAGKFGNGSTAHSRVPVRISNLNDVTQVTVGVNQACAATASGAAYCWGWGRMGDGSGHRESLVPVRVPNLGDVASVSTGDGTTCALVQGGAVYCWGRGMSGRLGNGGTVDSNLPVRVSDPSGSGHLSGISAISTGRNHTCALGQNGAVYCWGQGLLGDGDVQGGSTVPVRVRTPEGNGDLAGITHISAGGDTLQGYTCAAGGDGAGYCWGHNGLFGKLGDGTTTHRALPIRVRNAQGTGDLGGVIDITTSPSAHTCAATANGAYCWAANLNGAGGNGSFDTSNAQTSFVPVPVLPVYR